MNAMQKVGHSGKGVHSIGQIPFIRHSGIGVHQICKRPCLSGRVVHKIGLRPEPDETADVRDPYNTNIYEWFRELAGRLRYVRVVCGDWTRICNGYWHDGDGYIAGFFFDPTYSVEDRDTDLYHHDSTSVGKDVEALCLERGAKPTYRIAGYDGEYQSLIDAGWLVESWKSNGGYGNLGGNNVNRTRERLFISPHCVKVLKTEQLELELGSAN